MGKREFELSESDPQLLGISDNLATSLAAGQTIDQAVAILASMGLDSDLIARGRALMEFRQEIARYKDLPPIPISAEVRRTSWYSGPMPQDHFWPAVHDRLSKSLPAKAVEDIHASTDRILSLLPPPLGVRRQDYHSRGLTLGYVQSGKTTNFISLISKAADRGYKIFIVLSGITDNLRNQTQERVDELLIGDDTHLWHRLTSLNELRPDGSIVNNDFKQEPTMAAAMLNTENSRFIAVVKKNSNRLTKLRDWLNGASPDLLRQRPILIIDDEADQASLNTSKQRDRQTKINKLITEINACPKIAFVAYSATPFANLLQDANPDSNSSLYPKDFIVPMPAPDGYFGAERLFGKSNEGEGPDADGLDAIRTIPPDEAVRLRHPRGRGAVHSWSPQMEPSLRASIQWFLLATAARRDRGEQASQHSTMLIHTSMLAEAHNRLRLVVDSELKEISKLDKHTLEHLHKFYLSEVERLPASSFGNTPTPWHAVLNHLPAVLAETRVIMDNYISADRLAYKSDERETVIVIGGNTLSRGLTLEGLCSSFFVRESNAYDTLLQMGRWFGYRRGYEDLCRLWITAELASWFRDLSLVEAEIREDMQRYDLEHLTPLEVAVRIRTHDKMRVTALAKMRDADETLSLSFTGRPAQTTIFYDSLDSASWLSGNVTATKKLFEDAQASGIRLRKFTNGGFRGLADLPVQMITDFLRSYNIHPDQEKSIPKEQLMEYIALENEASSLKYWNVVVKEDVAFERNLGHLPELDLGLGSPVARRQRLPLQDSRPGEANFRVMQSQGDRALDLDYADADLRRMLGLGTTDPITDKSILKLRQEKMPTTGLMVIYPISRQSLKPETHLRRSLDAHDDIIGLTLFFPLSKNVANLVNYKVARLPDTIAEIDDDEDWDSADDQDLND
jgi:hypothetical protein